MAKQVTTLKIKKRCNFCLKPLRADGTCQNPNCPRYVPETESEAKTETTNESEN